MSAQTAPETAVEIWKDQKGAPVFIPLSQTAAAAYSQGLVAMLVQSKVPKDATPAQVHALIEVSAALDLSPLRNEIWLANMGNGVVVLVGRDGYMKKAKEDTAFISCNGQAVYENDLFEPEYLGPEKGWTVNHKPKYAANRGKLLGAWALLIRKGFPPEFFFADINQFGKAKGAWQYLDAMIVKCAISYLLRVTYNLSGAVPYDEVAIGFIGPDGQVTDEKPETPPADVPDDLVALIERAQAIDKGRWRRVAILGRIPAADQDPDGHREATEAIVAELTAWIAEHEVVDAELVDDAPPPAPAVVGEIESPQARYEADAQWRDTVDRLLSSQMDLRAGMEDDPSLEGDLMQVEMKLHDLGVPNGWVPVMAGQGALDLDGAAEAVQPL